MPPAFNSHLNWEGRPDGGIEGLLQLAVNRACYEHNDNNNNDYYYYCHHSNSNNDCRNTKRARTQIMTTMLCQQRTCRAADGLMHIGTALRSIAARLETSMVAIDIVQGGYDSSTKVIAAQRILRQYSHQANSRAFQVVDGLPRELRNRILILVGTSQRSRVGICAAETYDQMVHLQHTLSRVGSAAAAVEPQQSQQQQQQQQQQKLHLEHIGRAILFLEVCGCGSSSGCCCCCILLIIIVMMIDFHPPPTCCRPSQAQPDIGACISAHRVAVSACAAMSDHAVYVHRVCSCGSCFFV